MKSLVPGEVVLIFREKSPVSKKATSAISMVDEVEISLIANIKLTGHRDSHSFVKYYEYVPFGMLTTEFTTVLGGYNSVNNDTASDTGFIGLQTLDTSAICFASNADAHSG